MILSGRNDPADVSPNQVQSQCNCCTAGPRRNIKCLRRDSTPLPKKILGASLLGIECDEVIHSILDVMYANAPYTVIQRAMHIHPTVTELIPTMLGELKSLE